MSQAIESPPHVPGDLVFDVDFYRLPGVEQGVQQAWLGLRAYPPVFYSPRNGGHWVIVSSEHLLALFPDTEYLSNAKKSIPAHAGDPMLPSEADPPDHAIYRALVQPMFTPRNIDCSEATIHREAARLIDSFHARGHCEFIAEFGQRFPITIFLSLMGLPLDDMPMLGEHAETLTRGSDPVERAKAWQAVQDYLKFWIVRRLDEPAEDLVSRIVHAQIGDRPISVREALGICTNLLLGGLDTISSMLGCIAHYLAENPDQRRELLGSPGQIPLVINELTRRFAVVAQGRVVKKDLQIGPALLKKGDRVLMPTMLYGLDEGRFHDPWTVDFDRKGAPHLTFGTGLHRCPGSYLARTEIKVFLQEWLQRIPNFELTPGTRPVFSTGMVSAVLCLPLTWQPSSTPARV